jgi:hypothetical protein
MPDLWWRGVLGSFRPAQHPGLQFLRIEWANAAATGLIWTECGYVHEFAGNAIQLYKTG